jgi:hypothetical protein
MDVRIYMTIFIPKELGMEYVLYSDGDFICLVCVAFLTCRHKLTKIALHRRIIAYSAWAPCYNNYKLARSVYFVRTVTKYEFATNHISH